MAFQHSELWVAMEIYKWLYFLVCRRHDVEASFRRLSPLLSPILCILSGMLAAHLRLRFYTSPQKASTCVNTASVSLISSRVFSPPTGSILASLAGRPASDWRELTAGNELRISFTDYQLLQILSTCLYLYWLAKSSIIHWSCFRCRGYSVEWGRSIFSTQGFIIDDE